jgi:hypothetical protein
MPARCAAAQPPIKSAIRLEIVHQIPAAILRVSVPGVSLVEGKKAR